MIRNKKHCATNVLDVLTLKYTVTTDYDLLHQGAQGIDYMLFERVPQGTLKLGCSRC